MAIIAGHGTLDAAYPPLILATAAVAMDMEAAIFFTFYGLEILKKGKADKLQGRPDRQPGHAGADAQHHRHAARHDRRWPPAMMNSWMKKAKVAKLSELLEMAVECGVQADRLPDDHGRHGHQEGRPDRRRSKSAAQRPSSNSPAITRSRCPSDRIERRNDRWQTTKS